MTEQPEVVPAGAPAPGPEFDALLGFLKRERGFDFTGYKRPSLHRRVWRRMQAVDVETFADYIGFLEANPDEFAELFNTILINVTGFFRDRPTWEFLAETVIPETVARERNAGAVRVWSAGTASGEEAFSITMLLAEQMGEEAFRERVKVYATDVDDDALREARHALYPDRALDAVPGDLRSKYFEHRDGLHVFKPELRRSVIFGRHDLTKDPPIPHIDLLLARNTLMYFGRELQTKVLGDLHFALDDEGVLVLGKSEMLLTRSNLFEPIDLKRRAFRKVPGSGFRDRLHRMVGQPVVERPRPPAHELAREIGFDAAPVAQLVVDSEHRLALANLQARRLFGVGRNDVGKPIQDLEVSYRPLELRSRIDEAHTEHRSVMVRDVEWPVAGEQRFFDVQVTPLAVVSGEVVGAGIAFVDVTRYHKLQSSVEHQKERLETAYEELQATAEELETTNEELQATNEELETTNEELQATNEELETMNEELQSTNEELETMNDELRQRTEELDEVNVFLESILGSLRAGVIVTDKDLVVQAWNDYAADLWGLRSDEVEGRHLLNLDIGLPVNEVAGHMRACLAAESDGSGSEFVVGAVNRRGRSISLRVACTPLRDVRGDIRGAILQMEEQPA